MSADLTAMDRARATTRIFILRAAGAEDAKEAADWSLAAKNMAGTLHSLIGAQAHERRTA